MPRKSKKSRVLRWIPGTSFDRKTLTPFGKKLDVELRILYEDTSYDFENYCPVIVSDFNGNESDGNKSNDFGPDVTGSGSDSDSDSDCEEEEAVEIYVVSTSEHTMDI